MSETESFGTCVHDNEASDCDVTCVCGHVCYAHEWSGEHATEPGPCFECPWHRFKEPFREARRA